VADIQRVVEILFNATDNTSGALKKMESNFANLEQAFQPFAQAQESLIGLEKKILAVSVALGGLSVFEAGKFQESIAEVGTLFNASSTQVEGLRQEVLDFAATSSSAIGDSTTALYNYISATGDTENAVKALADIEKLAIAGRADLNTTTGAITTVLNAYGLGMEDIADVSDIFFTTVQNGTTTLPELGSAIGRVASTAAAAGVGFDVIGASMAGLTGAIGDTNLATTGLSALLRELSKPTDELRAALGPLADVSGQLPEKLKAIKAATGGTQVEMNKLFGSVEASNAALILGNDAAGTFANTLLALEDRTGKTAEAYAEMEKQFSAVNQRLINATRTSLIEAGSNLVDGYGGVASELANIFATLTPEIRAGAFDPIFNFLNGKADELEGIFAGIADVLPEALAQVDFSRYVKSLDSLLNAVQGLFDELFGGVDLTTAEGLSDAIETVINAFAALNEIVAGIAEQWKPLFTALGEILNTNEEMDSSIGQTVGNFVALGAQLGALSGIASSAAGALSTVADVAIVLTSTRGLAGLGATLASTATGIAAVAGPLAALAAAGVAGFSIGKAFTEITGLDEVSRRFGGWLYEAINGTEEFGDAAVDAAAKSRELTSATADASVATEQNADATNKAAKERNYLKEVQQSAIDTAKADEEQAKKNKAASQALATDLKGLVPIYDDLTGKIIGFDSSGREAYLATKQLDKAIKDADGNIVGYGKSTDKAKTATDKLAESQAKAEKEAKELQLKLLEIASDERVRKFEIAYDFNIAQVEAEATKVEAAFNSINTTLETSADLVGTLFSAMDSSRWETDKMDIKQQIERELELRERAADLQARLTEEQIRNLRLRNQKMAEGGALIEVDGTGLQPHLEAFMFELLEAIQVRVNQDGYEYLLGAQP